MTLEPQQTPLAETDYLPEPGYFLDDEPPDVAPVIQRALELGKVVAVAGQVEQVNRSAGKWGLLTDHGVKTGKVAPGGPDLDGFAGRQALSLQVRGSHRAGRALA